MQVGEPMIREEFPFFADRIAVGLVGHGSECFGYDDQYSQDHDAGVGFCLWVTEEDYRRIGKDLAAAYRALPRPAQTDRTTQEGRDYRGVRTVEGFYRPYIGTLPSTNLEWLRLDTRYLAEATNGEVWRDDLGEFSRIRKTLLAMPEDVRLQKMAAHTAFAAQSGQYNFARCVAHGELIAASHALNQFAYHIAQLASLLAGRYAPYYKWLWRSIREFELGQALYPLLTRLTTQGIDPDKVADTVELVDEIAALVIAELRRQELSFAPNDYLEPHAYQIRRHIQDPAIKELHVMTGVNQ